MVKKEQPTPAQQAKRITEAVIRAKELLDAFKTGDAEALTEATLLQGILSGDVLAATIMTKLKMQAQAMRLRQLLARSRLKTEALKQRIYAREAQLLEKEHMTTEQHQALMTQRIRNVYGFPAPQLPPAPDAMVHATESNDAAQE